MSRLHVTPGCVTPRQSAWKGRQAISCGATLPPSGSSSVSPPPRSSTCRLMGADPMNLRARYAPCRSSPSFSENMASIAFSWQYRMTSCSERQPDGRKFNEDESCSDSASTRRRIGPGSWARTR